MSFQLSTKWVVTEVIGLDKLYLPAFDSIRAVTAYIEQRRRTSTLIDKYILEEKTVRDPWIHGTSTCVKGSPPCKEQHRNQWCEFNEHNPSTATERKRERECVSLLNR